MDGKAHYIGKWDLLIAHPPCTYLAASSGVCLFNPDHSIKDAERETKGWNAREFFMQIRNADIDKIAARIIAASLMVEIGRELKTYWTL